MRLLILSPTLFPDLTGNAVTTDRLASGLRGTGVEVRAARSDDADLDETVRTFRPHLLHALHARKSGLTAMTLAERHKIPFVVTITGTDLNIDLLQLKSREVSDVLEAAAAVIVYSELTKERMATHLPHLATKIALIKPSIAFPSAAVPLPTAAGLNFLLPAGIRRVKDPVFPIAPLARLREEIPSLTLTVAGPPLDAAEWSLFREKVQGRGWIDHQTVSHDRMASLYGKAHVVLNTSQSEGLANAVLEGMYFGRPILASDCEGNRAAVSDGAEGLLYRMGNEDDFLEKARRLALDPKLRERLGDAAREKIAREYRLDLEIDGHRRLYRSLIEAGVDSTD